MGNPESMLIRIAHQLLVALHRFGFRVKALNSSNIPKSFCSNSLCFRQYLLIQIGQSREKKAKWIRRQYQDHQGNDGDNGQFERNKGHHDYADDNFGQKGNQCRNHRSDGFL